MITDTAQKPAVFNIDATLLALPLEVLIEVFEGVDKYATHLERKSIPARQRANHLLNEIHRRERGAIGFASIGGIL